MTVRTMADYKSTFDAVAEINRLEAEIARLRDALRAARNAIGNAKAVEIIDQVLRDTA